MKILSTNQASLVKKPSTRVAAFSSRTSYSLRQISPSRIIGDDQRQLSIEPVLSTAELVEDCDSALLSGTKNSCKMSTVYRQPNQIVLQARAVSSPRIAFPLCVHVKNDSSNDPPQDAGPLRDYAKVHRSHDKSSTRRIVAPIVDLRSCDDVVFMRKMNDQEGKPRLRRIEACQRIRHIIRRWTAQILVLLF